MTAKDFFFGLPDKVTPEMIKEVDTLFHFDISGDKGGQFSVKVAEGNMEVLEGYVGEAKCEIKADGKNFFGVLSGEVNPMMAVLMGKIKISNQEELMKYARIFGMA